MIATLALVKVWALSGLLLAPPTLADGLRAVGALASIDERLTAVAPAKTGSTILLSVSATALFAGVIGYFTSPACVTQDAAGRCVDARGSAPVFPSLIVLGLGGLATGAWWHQRLPVPQR
ncbi:MAG: hypothetical protein ACI9U2_002492 [Bradymonadia bacterium]